MTQTIWENRLLSSKRLLLPLLILATSLLASCSDYERPIDVAYGKQELIWGNGTEIQGLDPHIVTGVPEHRVITALCEGLTAPRAKGGPAEAGVAHNWTISNDQKTYTFHLRPNAQWHNGDPVTAQDYVWSWKRFLTPSMAAPFAEMLYPIEHAEAYNTGAITDFNEVGVKALDTHTLQVVLRAPTPYFLSILKHYSTYAVHRQTVLAHGAMDERNSVWTRAGNFVCNGPFKLQSWIKDQQIHVVRASTYWDKEQVRLNSITFLPVDKASTEERMFRSGQLHITAGIPLEQIQTWRGKPAMHSDPYLGTYFYRLNITRPPLDDVRVRRALALSIDRKQLIDRILGTGELPANSFTPAQPQLGFVPDTKQPFDPEQARQLLAEAGYPNGEGIRPLELLYNTSEGHQKLAVAIQEMWRKHLGIQIELLNQDWKVYLQRQQQMQYDIARAGWIADYEDPNSFLNIMVTGRGNNETGFSDSRFDTLIRKAEMQTGAERIQTLLQAEHILIEAQPVIPIYFYARKYLLSEDVKGWHANILDTHPPKYLYLHRD
ncbi:MAG: peptide ABC transporter substrate-binding protein [Gammaproteobacteria bacterium]